VNISAEAGGFGDKPATIAEGGAFSKSGSASFLLASTAASSDANTLHRLTRAASASTLSRLPPGLSVLGANQGDQRAARYSFFPTVSPGLTPQRAATVLGSPIEQVKLIRRPGLGY
jgi:hypothetical protein